MRIQKVAYFKPQFAETHGLFGMKHFKRHNMRDDFWTAHDLIEQYVKISLIYEKDNKVKKSKCEQDEMKQAEDFKRLKKERKDKIEELNSILKGDVQRTKNVLINFPLYMKMYQNKQSFEVLEELRFKAFHLRKKLDRCIREREKQIHEYETYLREVAHKQEIIRYYDIKEFQSERDTKRIVAELKNSESRLRSIDDMNRTYKYMIDQLLHDSLFYQPVLEALNYDWDDQTRLVQQTFNIGHPAIMHMKKMEKEVARVMRILREESNERFTDLQKVNQVLKEHPKIVKQFVRRDSDFEMLGDRYVRETPAMTEIRENVEKIEKDIKMLKTVTLSPAAEDILTRVESMLSSIGKNKTLIAGHEATLKKKKEESEQANFVRHILLEDYPEIYKEELFVELKKIEQTIKAEKEVQKQKLEAAKTHQNLIATMRFAMQHFLDVLRHVGTEQFYIEREYPNEVLELPLLKFNSNLPETPKILQWDFDKLVDIITTKANILIQHYDGYKDTTDEELQETTKMYQNAVVEDYFLSYRPKSPSLDAMDL